MAFGCWLFLKEECDGCGLCMRAKMERDAEREEE